MIMETIWCWQQTFSMTWTTLNILAPFCIDVSLIPYLELAPPIQSVWLLWHYLCPIIADGVHCTIALYNDLSTTVGLFNPKYLMKDYGFTTLSGWIDNLFLTVWYFRYCLFSRASQQRGNNSKQYDYTEYKTCVIYGLHDYWNFIGVDKLRATDYFRKLGIWHHQCHEQ